MDYDPGDQEGVISNGDDDVDEDGESNDKIFVSLKCDKTRKTYLKTVWSSLNPPVMEDNLVGKLQFINLVVRIKNLHCMLVWLPNFFWVTEHGHAVALEELDCLQRKLGSSDKILSAHRNGQHDLDIISCTFNHIWSYENDLSPKWQIEHSRLPRNTELLRSRKKMFI